MTKRIYIGLALGLGIFALTSTSAMAETGAGGTGIVGTDHDLGTMFGSVEATGQQRICIYCHHPHNTATTGEYRPLWNRAVEGLASFDVYTNGANSPAVAGSDHALNAMDAGLANGPGAVSRLCLSCHDGAVALDTYTGTTGSNIIGGIDSNGAAASKKDIGSDSDGNGVGELTNHHPVGFNYIAVATADSEIADADGADQDAVYPNAGTFTVRGGAKLPISELLYNNQMECVTCHDVHNSTNNADADSFLWEGNAGSKFCLVCHLK